MINLMQKIVCITLLLLLPAVVFAESIPVKETLAQLVEGAIRETGLSINVPPDQMTEKSINISTIDGVSVCDPKAKENVIALQKAFTANKNLRQTISIYGVYVRDTDGDVKFLPSDSPNIKALIGECKYLYLSVK
jgi:hypothetical protein